jgi:acetyl esterase
MIPLKFSHFALAVTLGLTFVPCSPAQVPLLEMAAPKAPVGVPTVYKTVNGQELHVYISSPPDEFTGPRPAIVFFHGGGWTSGSVTQFNRQSIALAARGMVAIDVEYRLIAKPPAMDSPRICVEDAKSAIRWVREHAKELRVDPDRIVGSGGSAGGYLAGAAALVPEWNDPTDDLRVSPKPNALVLFFPAIAVDQSSPVQKRFGNDVKYAPETYLSATAPPTIIFAGLADKLVKPAALRHYKALADKAGARCELVFYENQVHGFANNEPYMTITLTAAESFLESLGYLRPTNPGK